MSIFGNIASAIFGTSKGVPPPVGLAAAPSSAATTSGQSAVSAAAAKPMSRDELEAMIEKIAGEQDENYNWDKSIVDLMKLLKLDSSFTARKQLAQELGYRGKLDGSTEMNVWLHKQVMVKLTESGGKMPESLKRA
jgi:Domain of unknown function (DUF3597)